MTSFPSSVRCRPRRETPDGFVDRHRGVDHSAVSMFIEKTPRPCGLIRTGVSRMAWQGRCGSRFRSRGPHPAFVTVMVRLLPSRRPLLRGSVIGRSMQRALFILGRCGAAPEEPVH
jgi:hypothetical protein